MIKNSVGIWAFGPAVTRFVPPGYHNEVADEPMADKTRRVCEGLSDVLEGLEYHYPGEVNEENLAEIRGILRSTGWTCRWSPRGSTPTRPTAGAPS
jgi:xylose isomerase